MSEPTAPIQGIDPRGPRFAAWITTVVLAVVLLTSSGWLLAVQALIFAIGAFAGLRYAPYGFFYRTVLRKAVNQRWGPPSELEAEAPPRFAQGVGFAFALVGTVGYLSGGWIVGLVATAFALIAAFLNAAFGYCLGCQVYLLIQRFVKRSTTDKGVTA
jgi:hypothetical protein